jgi:small subunit ribosomal protein S4
VARTLGPVCRLCRREGIKLYLKGARCDGPKCAINKRNFPPGQHGLSRKKLSTYGQQLRQKQKAKRVYGVLERQFRRYFRMAERYRGVTGTTLLQVLERRLDNIVFRLGFAPSRKAARQMVGHGNVTVEGRKANIPSMLVKIGQKVSIREKLRENDGVRRSLEKIDREGRPSWLEYSAEDFSGRMLSIPSRQDIPTEVDEQMIVELYSK